MAGNKDRQRRAAREKHRRQQEQRRARQQRNRKVALTALSVLAAGGLIVGLLLAFIPGSSAKPSASASRTPTASASVAATPSASTVAEPAHHCTYTSVPSGTPVAKKVAFPSAAPNYTAAYTATIKTNQGTLSFNLLNSKATCTVNSFVHLADLGFFNNTQCHRLVTSGIYVLQCGDALATAGTKLSCPASPKAGDPGTGTPGYEFGNENVTGATYPAATVAMANAGAGTNGSQFFIVYKDSTSGLVQSGQTPAYTPFATVSSGLNIVQNVAKDGFSCQSATGDGVPKEKVIIDSVTIKQT